MLTQNDVDYLLDVLKRLIETQTFSFPQTGEYKTLEAVSTDKNEKFLIDINRSGKINIKKCTYQERYRKEEILLRLDIAGPPHTNPDGESIACPHIHIYKEGYADRWAYPLPDNFTNTNNLIESLIDFLEYCKIENALELDVQVVME